MHDMEAFDSQLASVVLRRVGPSQPVDDAAIFNAVIAATRSRQWRFQPMFSATRFVVACAIVALFGGLLLTGALTQPTDESVPAVGASATAEAERSASVTAEPEPTMGLDVEPTTRSDLVAGVDLITEEVEPGVLRIIGDGAGHDLDERHPSDPYDLTSIAITPDGTIWLSAAYSFADDDVNPPGPLVWALGQPDVYTYTPEGGDPERLQTLVTDEDGTLLMVSDKDIVRFDGTGFVPDDRVARRLSTGHELWTIDPAQLAGLLEESLDTDEDMNAESVMNEPRRFLVAVWLWNGDAWTTLSEAGRSASASDGTRVAHCWIEGGIRCEDGAQVSTYLEATDIRQLVQAPDGSLWAIGDHADGGAGLYRISAEELLRDDRAASG